MGVVIFAHGGFYVLGGYLAYTFSHAFGLPFFASILLAVIGTS
jgi:branched-chain amino acid transport system permease protein